MRSSLAFTLKPPKLENANGWKIYGTTTDQRGDERRQLSGNVVFHQSIRPLEIKSEIPPFRLVYFDPKDQSYKTLTTEAIALQMRPNTTAPAIPPGPPQLLPIPLERMSDILAVIRPAHAGIMIARDTLDALLDARAAYQPHDEIFAMKAQDL